MMRSLAKINLIDKISFQPTCQDPEKYPITHFFNLIDSKLRQNLGLPEIFDRPLMKKYDVGDLFGRTDMRFL